MVVLLRVPMSRIIMAIRGCSKLMTSLDKVLLKFQTSVSEIHQYLLSKKCEKQCKSFSHFFVTKISVYLVIKL